MSAAAIPSWVLLEPFILRRDKAASFPDETKAPISFSGTTSCGDAFLLAFHLAEPPRISSLYAHLPAFGRKETPVAFLSTHRHLALLRVGTLDYHNKKTQDFFVFDASATDVARSLVHLPVCMEPPFDYSRLDGSLRPRRRRRRHRPRLEEPRRVDVPRLLAVGSMGLLSRGEQEFAVATLDVYMPKDILFADMYLFRSSAGRWDSVRVPVLHSGDPVLDTEQLSFWMTDSVVPIGRWLCWIDYCRGILFCDVFAKPKPTVSYLRLPLDKFPKSNNRGRTCSWMNRRVSVIDNGNVLKFVDVARSDDRGYKALKPGAGFTITCHTLMLDSVNVWDKETIGSVVWHKDWTVTSNELWLANPPELLPREVPTFPQVNIDKPHMVHFLVTEFGYVMKKMWVVAIDMSTSKVQSCSQYVNGRDDTGTEWEQLTYMRSMCPMPFLPCEFTKYLLNYPRGGSRALLAPPTDAHDAIDPFLELLASYKIFEEEDEEIKMEEGKEDEPLPICCTRVATDGRVKNVKDVDCTAGRVKDVKDVDCTAGRVKDVKDVDCTAGRVKDVKDVDCTAGRVKDVKDVERVMLPTSSYFFPPIRKVFAALVNKITESCGLGKVL